MWQKRKSKIKAFTLIELLVVIAILGILMGILVPTLVGAMGRGKRTACLAEIQQLETALKVYESDYRDFPPSLVSQIGVLSDNKINSGIEALVACLSSVQHSAPYFQFRDEQLNNSDQDTSKIPLQKLTGSIFKTNSLWELVDPWGNPYIYFHNRDILPTTKQFYILPRGKKEVTPKMEKTKTGNIRGDTTYQLMSCGIDGSLHTQDDLMSK